MLSIFQELNPTLQSPLLFPTSENTSSHYTSNFPVVVPQTSQDGQDDPLMSHTRSGMSEHCALKRGERQSPSAFSLPVGRTHLENVPTGPAANNTNTLEGPHIKGFFDGLQRTLSATPGTIQISLSNFSLSPDKFAQVKRHKFTSAVLVACTLVSFLVWMRTFNWDVISMLFFTLVSGSFALSVWFHRERTHHLLDEMHEKMEALQHSVKSLELSIPRELVVPDVVQGGFPVLAREVPTRREMLEQSVQTSEQTATFRPDGYCGPQGHRDNTMGLLDVGITGSAAEQQCSPSVPVQGPSLRHLPIPEGHPEVSSMLSNFADGLHFIFSRTGDAEHLEGSMALYRSAVEYPFSSARDRLIPAKNWTITARSTRHSSALTAYRKALFLLQRAIDLGPTVQTRHEYISGRDIEPLRSLPMDAASYAIESRAYEEAIEMLEQGRTLLWSGMRSLRTPLENLHQVDNSLADEFTEISQALEAIITTTDVRDFVQTPAGTDDDGVVIGRKDTFAHDLAEKRRLSGELDKVVLRIQALPGFENFWRPIPFRHLQTAAMGGPVVIINLSEYRSDILIIRSNHPVVHIPTPTNFFDRVKKLAHRLSETRKSYRLESKTYNRTLRRTLEELSELVGRPVADRLMELGIPEQSRIWLCPTSVLASLPIHAAGPISSHTNVKRYLCDIYVCSYTPSLSALIASGPRNLSGSASGQPPSLLIVGHPDQALPGVDSEIRSIECLVGNDSVTKITGEAATPENVIARLPMHPWVHFACHGVLQPGRPFESSFLLQYNTHLTLLRIAKSHLPTAELAFLAACHTAELTEDSTPDEVLHLTAAMQFSGFRSVIGTLWAMADEDGQDLSEHFYRKMMFAAGAQVASYEKSARALRYATQKLRTKKGISLERWVNFVHYGA
ncbi:CHAT domain-containing protein [Lactifluus subvellereus]|nr:CHAT domain-containing protein [Lactifluus subvellereus]